MISIKRNNRILRWLSLLVVACFIFVPLQVVSAAPYSHTILMDGSNDFYDSKNVVKARNETFSTSIDHSFFYFTWDATNIYLAFKSPDVVTNVFNGANKWVWLYFGGSGGTTTGVNYSGQQPTLPFAAKYHLRYKVNGSYTNLQSWNGTAWTSMNTTIGVNVNNANQFVELRIPRADLGINNSKTLALVANLAFEDTTGNSDSMWASVPADAFSNGNGFNRNFNKFYEFDLESEDTASAAQVYSYEFFNTSITPSAASFSFLANPNAQSVKVQYSTNNGTNWVDGQLLQPLNSDSRSATVVGLTPNSKYKFRLLVNGGTNVGSSAIVNVTTFDGPVDTSPPTAPTIATVSEITHQSAKLSWTASTDDVSVTTYDILRNGMRFDSVLATNRSYTASGLLADTNYSFSVRAVDSSGNPSSESASISVRTAKSPTSNAVKIYYKRGFTSPNIHYQPEGGAWTTSPGVVMPSSKMTGFHEIEIDLKQATKLNVAFNNGSGTWDNNNNTNYTFANGVWTYTPGINGAPGTITAGSPDQNAPTSPNGLVISNVTATGFTASWMASTDNVGIDGYDVYLNGLWAQTVNENSVVITNLNAFTQYKVAIIARDVVGNESIPSDLTLIKTLDNIAPTAPMNLKADAISDKSFKVTWDKSTDNDTVKAYRVLLNGIELKTTSANECLFENMQEATTYNIIVQAIDQSDNESVASGSLSVTTPDVSAPSKPSLQIDQVSVNQISLKWDASVDNSNQVYYELYVNDSKRTTLTDIKYSLTDLTEFTTYNIYLIAKDASGNTSDTSNVLQVTTLDVSPPSVPNGLTAIEVGNTTFTVNWLPSTDNDNVQYYQLLLNGKPFEQSMDTMYMFTNLTERTKYSLQVTAVDRSGNVSQASETLFVETLDATAPSTPESLKAASLNGNSIVVSWNASFDQDDQISYEVYVNDIYKGTVTNTQFLITGLSEFTTYTVTVRAIDRAENASSFSAPLEVTTLDGTKPEVPKEIVVDEIKGTGFVVRWQAATDNVAVTGYHVYVNGVKTASVSATTTYKFVGLKDATTYKVQVSAIDDASNESELSESLLVTTLDETSPSVPQKLVVEAINQSGFTLTWQAATDNVGVTAYDVYLNNQWVNTVKDTRFVFIGLDEFRMYQVSVKAKDASENSSLFTDPFSVTTLDVTGPSLPTNLVASNQTDNAFTLTWNESKDNDEIFGYEVYLNGQWIESVSTTSYRFEKLTDLLTHQVTVRAIDRSGNKSMMSPQLSIAFGDKTPPSNPTNIKVHTKTTDSVKISWSGASDNDRVVAYVVLRNGVKEATVTVSEYTFRKLRDFTKHSIEIQAIDAAGNISIASPAIEVTTLDATAPTAPSNLVASNVTIDRFTLNWNAAKDNDAIAEYEVYVNDRLRDKVNATQYTVTNLNVGDSYKVTVRAIDFNSNVSPLSKPISVDIRDRSAPSIPQKVTIRDITGDGFTVSWTKAKDNVGVVNYEVYSNGKLLAKTNQNRYKLTGLTTKNVISITIRAVDRAGNRSTATSAVQTVPAIKVYGNDVFVNFNKLKFTSSAMPKTRKGVLMVSYKPLLEALGFKVQYELKTKVITASKNGQTMRMTIGSSMIVINGQTKKSMGATPIVVNGNVMIPIKFFATELKFQYLTK